MKLNCFLCKVRVHISWLRWACCLEWGPLILRRETGEEWGWCTAFTRKHIAVHLHLALCFRSVLLRCFTEIAENRSLPGDLPFVTFSVPLIKDDNPSGVEGEREVKCPLTFWRRVEPLHTSWSSAELVWSGLTSVHTSQLLAPTQKEEGCDVELVGIDQFIGRARTQVLWRHTVPLKVHLRWMRSPANTMTMWQVSHIRIRPPEQPLNIKKDIWGRALATVIHTACRVQRYLWSSTLWWMRWCLCLAASKGLGCSGVVFKRLRISSHLNI